jgi:hypothetical protein
MFHDDNDSEVKVIRLVTTKAFVNFITQRLLIKGGGGFNDNGAAQI